MLRYLPNILAAAHLFGSLRVLSPTAITQAQQPFTSEEHARELLQEALHCEIYGLLDHNTAPNLTRAVVPGWVTR